jgi:hypothetical protein
LGDFGANGGAGASASLTNAVEGSTTGRLTLSQTAIGGGGGSTFDAGSTGAAGAGGNASSTLKLKDGSASDISANTSANGGAGGSTDTGTAGDGGNATSVVNVTTTIGATVDATAYAEGGASQNAGNSGVASASAFIQGAARGYASAQSTTSSASGTVSTNAYSPVGGPASAITRASIDTAPVRGLLNISAGKSRSKAILLPASSTADGGGAMSIGYGGDGKSLTYETEAFFEFTPPVATAGDFALTLEHENSLGGGFDSSILDVYVNEAEFSYSFSTLAEAQAFFTDDVIDLGSYSGGVISVNLDYRLTASEIGDGFAFSYRLGAVSAPELSTGFAAVPETSTWAMMLLGFAGLGLVGSRSRATKDRKALDTALPQ